MSRLHALLPLTLLGLAAGCAPMRQPGALSLANARVTNEVLGEDQLTFDAWARRVAALQRTPGVAPSSRVYAMARAGAWLSYARDAYAWDPRDGVADSALAETRRIVLALEAGRQPEPGAIPEVSDARARPDLWATLARARDGSAADVAPVALADAEVALVRAVRLTRVSAPAAGTRVLTDTERACELQLQVATAERLLTGLPGGLVPVPAPIVVAAAPAVAGPAVTAPSVTLQADVPVAPVRPAYRPSLTPASKRGIERSVHFAVGSSQLALSSRVTLGEVIAMLRSHPKVNLVIEGFTDPRGNPLANRELAVRRAAQVRRFLDAADVSFNRVTIVGVGADSAAAVDVTPEKMARDRRVTLAFTDSTGIPITPAAYQLYDIDRARDLQVEQRQRRSARAARKSPRVNATPRTTPR